MKNSLSFTSKTYAIAAVLSCFLFTSTAFGQTWQLLENGKPFNISGMSLIDSKDKITRLLVAIDNRDDKDKNRIALVKIDGSGKAVKDVLLWKGELPIDLEALTSVPGQPGKYIVLASSGRIFPIMLDLGSMSVSVFKGSFMLPLIPVEADFEGFSLQKINNNMVVAVWADRGKSDKPATLFYSRFNTDNYTFDEKVSSIPISVPYPSGSFVRHIADVKADSSGKVFIVAALDTDDDNGPFSAAYYSAGQLNVTENGKIDFVRQIVKLDVFDNKKVEGFEFIPGGVAFGTDDENKGGSLLVKLANTAEIPRYPAHWFAAVNDPKKPGWEILPQEAKPGEVILSKRNELGLLSNFAPTPFEYRGKRYASLEGFWQMMLYPEDKEDPRAKFPGLAWNYTREQVSQMTAFEAKSAGTLAEENMKKMGIDWVSFEGKRFPYRPANTGEPGEHYRLIVEAMRAKMEQNPEVKRVLLQTGGLVLKPDHHAEPNSPAAWRYNEIWMQIRSELQK